MKAAFKILGYLKKYPKRGIVIDCDEPIGLDDYEILEPDFGHQYSDYEEEIDSSFPIPLMDEIRSTIFVDSNYSHDKVTGKSITGLVGFLGGTPITWYAKRQSSVMTSTFGAEFTSLKKAVEEAEMYRYYCRAFGMKMTKPTVIFEDNMAVVLNSSNPGSTLQHKSIALSYHFCREHVSGGVVKVRHIRTDINLSDAMTKALDSTAFHNCIMPYMWN